MPKEVSLSDIPKYDTSRDFIICGDASPFFVDGWVYFLIDDGEGDIHCPEPADDGVYAD